jgi:hypothetical protein
MFNPPNAGRFTPNARRFTSVVALLVFYCLVAAAIAHAQDGARPASDSRGCSDSEPATTRARRAPLGEGPTEMLRNARTVYVEPNRHVNAEYLEYKLDKLPEFRQWRLAFVKDREKADLRIEISKTALNYIFSVVEPESSVVVVKGMGVAINGRIAAEDMSHQIVKRMRTVRALPEDEQ